MEGTPYDVGPCGHLFPMFSGGVICTRCPVCGAEVKATDAERAKCPRSITVQYQVPENRHARRRSASMERRWTRTA